MPLVAFSKEALEDATLLPSFPSDVLTEFAQIAFDQLRSGSTVNKAKYTKAADALKVELAALVRSIQSLSHILLEGARRNATGDELVLSLDGLTFKEDQKTALRDAYTLYFRDLRLLLSDLSLTLPHYHNLEWRLDVQLGTRFQRNHVQPVILVELETRSEDGAGEEKEERKMMQLDYANLDHLVKQLELAVKEVNTKHARRIVRYVK
jgi:hypothetical protein